MNPMVDLAFLLVTFFMLSTTFKTADPVKVTVPEARSEIKLPETDVAVLTVAEDGRVFFGVDGKFTREALLRRMSEQYERPVSEQQLQQFGLISSFGMPLSALPDFLDTAPARRKHLPQPGIPYEKPQNELRDWVVMARVVNPKLRFAINGDGAVPYPKIKTVMDLLVAAKINRFNLVTEREIPSDGN